MSHATRSRKPRDVEPIAFDTNRVTRSPYQHLKKALAWERLRLEYLLSKDFEQPVTVDILLAGALNGESGKSLSDMMAIHPDRVVKILLNSARLEALRELTAAAPATPTGRTMQKHLNAAYARMHKFLGKDHGLHAVIALPDGTTHNVVAGPAKGRAIALCDACEQMAQSICYLVHKRQTEGQHNVYTDGREASDIGTERW